MTNRESILRLADNPQDAAARKALFENNKEMMEFTIKEFFVNENTDKVKQKLMHRLVERCRVFSRRTEDADCWLDECIEIEVARLYKSVVEVKRMAAHV
jgi:hypothetical protein